MSAVSSKLLPTSNVAGPAVPTRNHVDKSTVYHLGSQVGFMGITMTWEFVFEAAGLYNVVWQILRHRQFKAIKINMNIYMCV